MHRLQRQAWSPYVNVAFDVALQRTTLDPVTGEVEDNENLLIPDLTDTEFNAFKEFMRAQANQANAVLNDGMGEVDWPLINFKYHGVVSDHEVEFNASLLDPTMTKTDVEQEADQLLSTDDWKLVDKDQTDSQETRVQVKLSKPHNAGVHRV